MGDVIFVLKTLVITIALVTLMQIKIGSRTIEQHGLAWMHHSVIVEQLQDVAAGAVKVGQKGATQVKSLVNGKTDLDVHIEKIGSDALSTKANRD